MNLIIYGSKYGSAKKYAEELARRTGFELAPYEEAGDINGYETIVYIGALYAGGVLGMKKTLGKLKDIAAKKNNNRHRWPCRPGRQRKRRKHTKVGGAAASKRAF